MFPAAPPKTMGRKSNTLDQTRVSFWLRVKRLGKAQCWPWAGCLSENGYGRFSPSRSKTVSAHRLAFTLGRGPIPKGMMVCHHCDNRECCNPTHLFVGTAKDNRQDALSKGRVPTGVRHHAAKLRDCDVAEIRRRYTRRIGVGALAKKFGISMGYLWVLTHQKVRL